MKSPHLWTLGWITGQAGLLWSVTREPWVPLTAWVVAVCLLCKPIRSESRATGFAVSAILIGLYAVRTALVFLGKPTDLLSSISLIPVTAEVVLLAQLILICQNPCWPRHVGMLIACGMYVVCVTFWQRPPTDHPEESLLLAIAIALYAIGYAQRLRAASAASEAAMGTYGRRLHLACFGLVFVLSWPLADQMSQRLLELRQWVSNRVTLYVAPVQSNRSYVRVGNLRSILNEQTHDSAHVALRVFAEKPPGYLRGRVYDTYVDGEWHLSQRQNWRRSDRVRPERVVEPNSRMPQGISPRSDGQRLFTFSPSTRGPYRRLEIWNDPTRGKVFFLPLNSVHVVGEGEYLALDKHQAVHDGISTHAPYLAYATHRDLPTPLAERERAVLTAVPPNLDPKVVDLAKQIGHGQEQGRDKVKAVTRFFQEGFRYSLEGFAIPPRVDPVSFFLLERPPAHCEFFASASVALLRLMDVPCRYVTGYVVREESEYGDYWIARNRNAHAWVEAYDDSRQCWMVVESTPGMSTDGRLGTTTSADAAVPRPTDRFRQALRLGRYWLQPRWRNAWLAASGRWLRQPVLTILFISGLVWVVRQGTRRSRWLRGNRACEDSKAASQILQRMDKALRKYQLRRGESETLHQFAARLRRTGPEDPWLQQTADWYEAYATYRYGHRLQIPPIPISVDSGPGGVSSWLARFSQNLG